MELGTISQEPYSYIISSLPLLLHIDRSYSFPTNLYGPTQPWKMSTNSPRTLTLPLVTTWPPIPHVIASKTVPVLMHPLHAPLCALSLHLPTVIHVDFLS